MKEKILPASGPTTALVIWKDPQSIGEYETPIIGWSVRVLDEDERGELQDWGLLYARPILLYDHGDDDAVGVLLDDGRVVAYFHGQLRDHFKSREEFIDAYRRQLIRRDE